MIALFLIQKFRCTLAILWILLGSSAYAKAETHTISTISGDVVGQIQNGVAIYGGIPYAESPEGQLRWRAPVASDPWASPLKAFQQGPACLQAKGVGESQSIGSENCLNLNIWAPIGNKSSQAVMVFIHGGFYVEGSSDEKEFDLRIQDGFHLAKEGNVVVVSFDYRLGALGFLAAPALDDGSPESQSGNFGLMDQIAALKWIHENIASFGGDPTRVTVFGQSAGASSILTLMAAPQAEGLFSQAIVESGYLKAISRNQAFQLSNKLISQSGCAKETKQEIADCLRALSGEKVISSVPSVATEGSNGLFLPNDDGFIVKEPLQQAYDLGHVRRIPVIMGTNSDETSTLVTSLYGPEIKTDNQLAEIINRSYGASIWETLKPHYDNTDLGTPQERLIRLSTDLIFTCPISSLLHSLATESKDQDSPRTWRYLFSHHLSVPLLSRLGAFHGLEIAYVFGNLPALLDIFPSERDLSEAMLSYWSSFAKNGDPNVIGRQAWPEFRASNQSVLEFNTGKNGIQVLSDVKGEQCFKF